MLRSGKMKLSVGRAVPEESDFTRGHSFYGSFTRSRFGAYHCSNMSNQGIMLTLDGDALAERFKFVPTDYFRRDGLNRATTNNEMEERLVSNTNEIPILKYIKRVDIITPASLEKNKGRANDESKLLGLITRILRKNKIPYSFYETASNWANKRGEFSPIGKPQFKERSKYVGRADICMYEKMKAFLNLLTHDYSEMSQAAREIWDSPSSWNDLICDYSNAGRPNEYSPIVHDIAVKISRVIRRLGINTSDELQDYMGRIGKCG